MCDNAGLLAGYDHISKRILMTRANCDSWHCVECAARLRDRWAMRASIHVSRLLREGRRISFITLTSHERLRTFAASEAVWSMAWDTLYQAYKRRNAEWSYMMIPEQHKDGRMHVHGLWSGDVTKRWLKDRGRKSGMGYMADASVIKETSYAVRYVTKYLSKALGDDMPAHFRRVRISQNWAEIPKPDNKLVGLEWHYVAGNGALVSLYQDAEYMGYRLIDVGTGQVFDDVDLGTIAFVGVDKRTIVRL